MKALPRRQSGRPPGRMRSLVVEALEERQLLDAAPWQNPVYRLDVNNSSFTTPSDALILVNRILEVGQGGEPLPDPGPNPVPYYYDVNGDNKLSTSDLLEVINGIQAPPEVLVTSLTPYTIDVTPQITVTVSGTPEIANGTVFDLDVDLNDDGDFLDLGERGHTQSTFFGGSSTFQITPALQRSSQLYAVNLRARVKDSDGVVGTSPVLPLGVDTLTSDALENYVHAPDPSYSVSMVGSTNGPGFTYYVLDMTSQTWRSSDDVNLPVWHHWLEVYVPTGVVRQTALLLIDGGSNTDSPDPPVPEFGELAAGLQTVLIDLKGVPNEPVVFTDETINRSEDAIIAYTFDKFMANLGQPGNETWPLLLPMVKSAVRAMDTVQQLVPSLAPGNHVDDFLVTGYSKRGWTTWLTAAIDDRVRAIIPGVFDNLNQGPQMVHHYGVYGFFSYAVGPYEDLGIFSRLLTPESQQLSPITDPYRYLNNGRFDDMPKLLINSPGDQFFVTDSAQFYFDDIPGDDNYLQYIPNTSHGLDFDAVVASTTSFYFALLNNLPLPDFSWTVEQSGVIRVQTSTNPSKVLLWQATNPDARDFRQPVNPDITWTSTSLVNQGGGLYLGDVPIPEMGATGYFVELTFPNPIPQVPDYVFTTEVRVKSTLPFHPWPFEVGVADTALAIPAALDPAKQTAPAAVALAAANATRDAAAVALALDGNLAGEAAEITAKTLLRPAEDKASATVAPASAAELMLGDVPASAEPQAETDTELVDYLLEADWADLLT